MRRFSGLIRSILSRAGWICQSWRTGLLLLLPALGLAEFGLHQYFSRRAPTLQQWRELRPLVEESLEGEPFGTRIAQDSSQTKTLIVAAPAWSEPNARAALGTELMPLAHVARPDDSSFSFALEIGILGERAKLEGWQEVWHRQVGDFRLRGLTNPKAERVSLDFVDALSPKRVRVRTLRRGTSRACRYGTHKVKNGDLHGHPTFPRNRFACAGGDWHFVGVTVIEDQHYQPRRCLWAHPGNDEVLSIEYQAVSIGQRVRGYGGLPYFRERESHGAPVEMEVYVGGEKIGAYLHRDGEGWSPFDFDTRGRASEVLPVEFRVTSKRAAHREFCFQADVR